jgi:hypothetical protein
MVTHTGQIFHSTTPHQYHGVILKGMTLARDISRDLVWLVKRTLATLRNAEFGFFGVKVFT